MDKKLNEKIVFIDTEKEFKDLSIKIQTENSSINGYIINPFAIDIDKE